MYLDNDTFELYFTNSKNRFEVDTLIAKTIQTLNKKGYKTLFCCSGHGTKDKEFEVHSVDTDEIFIGYAIKNQVYITFAKDTILPTIPKGFTYTNENDFMQLQCIIPCNENIRNENSIRGQKERLLVFKKILKLNKELYTWSQNLEPNKQMKRR